MGSGKDARSGKYISSEPVSRNVRVDQQLRYLCLLDEWLDLGNMILNGLGPEMVD